MAHSMEFWLTAGSTYTYLTVHRVAHVVNNGVGVALRPFYLGRIFQKKGAWPFPDGAAKTDYMWRDIARRAPRIGLAPELPAPYPAPKTERANRVVHVATQAGLGLEFLIASYAEWFERGLLPGEDDHLEAALSAVGLDPATVIAAAEAPDAEAALVAATEEAEAKGIFGAPSFIVGTELFWGDDRLDDALSYALADLSASGPSVSSSSPGSAM